MDKIVLLIRPLLSSQEDSAIWEQAGFKIVRTPLLKIVFLKNKLPDLKNYQAVITTSSAAIRALAELTENRNMALWCVGKASLQIARNLSFQNLFTCSFGDKENATFLLKKILQELNPIKGPLLYLAGKFVHLDFSVELSHHGFEVDKVVVYESQSCLESQSAIYSHLKENLVKGITFYSQRTASLFKDFMYAYNLEVIESCYPLCLSSSISNIIQPFFIKSPIIASTTGQLIANLEKIL